MKHKFTEQFKRVRISPLLEEDIEELRILRNKNSKYFIYSNKISKEEQEVWYQKYLKNNSDIMFRISLINDLNTFIGAVALYNIDNINKEAEFGRIIIDKDKINEKGLGYEALICACKVGFERLKLERIVLEVFSDNISALKTYEKAGFEIYYKDNNLFKMELIKSTFSRKEKE